ncbi:carboxypeptidase regulatory-like domain-containing protein [Engelhardtia mirabilis]|uniref:carboxypeptidase regulatory-like domain-containing protein n=1 Tax=Engelhardtia mirabilis TaxID=2528011 RepID=UPI003AF39944
MSEALTDADGSFELAATPTEILRLAVLAAGFAPYEDDDLTGDFAADSTLRTIALVQGAQIAGRVVDFDGAPVVGAELRLLRNERGPTQDAALLAPAPLATSDAAGTFTIDRLACGPWSIEVTAAGHPSGYFHGRAERPGERRSGLEFALERGADIEGRVTGAPSFVLERVRVQARLSPLGQDDALEAPGLRRTPMAAVDGEGRFALTGLLAGREYELQAFERQYDNAPSALAGALVRSESARASAGERGVLLAYTTGAGLSFRVLNGRTGAPLSEFVVHYGDALQRPLLDFDGTPLSVHPGGRVFLEDLGTFDEEDRLQLTIQAAGFAQRELRDIALVPGAELSLGDILLEPVPTLRVTVLDAADRSPVAGASVSLSPQRDDPFAASERRFKHAIAAQWGEASLQSGNPDLAEVQRTDSAGVAVLTAPALGPCVLRVESPHHAVLEVEGIEVSPSEPLLDYEALLVAGGSVLVEAFDEHGEPLRNVRIERRPPAERDAARMPLPPGTGRRHVTDPSGRVLIDRLEAGRHGFRLERRSISPTLLSGSSMIVDFEQPGTGGWVEVDVVDGETATVAVHAPATGELTGQVTESGRPLIGARLALHPGDASSPAAASTTSIGEGTYRFPPLEVGSYLLRITHPDRLSAHEEQLLLSPGDNRLDLDLPVTEIRGVVRNASGAALPGMRVAVFEGGFVPGSLSNLTIRALPGRTGPERYLMEQEGVPAVERVTTEADGSYVLRGVPTDTPLTVVAWGGQYLAGTAGPVEVARDVVCGDVDLELVVGGTLFVSVANPDGSAPRRYIAEATRRGTQGQDRRVDSIVNGSVALGGLAQGTWDLRVLPQGPGNPDDDLQARAEVTAGETTRLDLRFP